MNQRTLSFCTVLLNGCKTVEQWNAQMKTLDTLGLTQEMRGYIESTGLIVKVLGVDKGQPYYPSETIW